MTYFRNCILLLILLLPSLSVAGNDPFENINKKTHNLNQALDLQVASPVARFYKRITPDLLERGITNFTRNIEDLSIAMIGACLTGAAYVLVRKASKLGESPYTIMFYFPFFSVLISLPFMSSTWAMPSMLCWVYIFFVGVFTQLGQLFLTFGYKVLPAGKAASTSYVQVPFSIIAGTLLFKDSLTVHFIIGSLVIFFSIFLIINDKNKNLNNYS